MSSRWARMSDFSIAVPDNPGELARLAANLGAAGINLVGLWGYGGDGTVARFYCVPENAQQFRHFAESVGLEVKEGQTFYLSGDDHIGALVSTLEQIATAGINLHAIQTVAFRGEFGCFVWAEEKDWDALTSIEL